MLYIRLILEIIFFNFTAMKRFLLFWFVIVAASAGFSQSRLLLIGDSITEGRMSQNGLGFRDDLYNSLSEANIPFVYVGPEGGYPFFGHYYVGALIDDFYYGAGGYGAYDVGPSMDYYKPNYVLVHLGTNGNENGKTIVPYINNEGVLLGNTMTGRLANLLTYLIQWQNGARGTCLRQILVSQIIDKPEYNFEVVTFNEEVGHIFQDSNDGKIPSIPPGTLRLVDQFTTFDVATMRYRPSSILQPNHLWVILCLLSLPHR